MMVVHTGKKAPVKATLLAVIEYKWNMNKNTVLTNTARSRCTCNC